MDADHGGARARSGVRLLGDVEVAGLRSELREVVEYRKSGLSLNWVVGCPLDCGYCVRHLFGNFGMKVPRALLPDEDAVRALVGHRFFRPHVTPVQLLNRATDPMLPAVKPHLFRVLRLLDERGLTNHVLVITRWRVEPEDCAALDALRNLRVTLLVTHSGIEDERVEPVDSGIAARSLETAFAHAERFRVVLYWRPIVPGLNDSDAHIARGLELSWHAHAAVFTGLFYRDEIRAYYRDHGLPEPYEDQARRKILPEASETRILTAAAGRPAGGAVLFRKTSCAVAYAHRVPDYNGHVGIRELCDICPAAQLGRCDAARTPPDPEGGAAMAAGLGGRLVAVTDRAVVVDGLDEQHRYFMQHGLGFQVHDAAKPHHPYRHGRADLGWPTTLEAS
ncbi:DNA repair photolyase [Saccharothrix longispora]|uniref:DNA repair photolyase n=1 Tax=Saccharothrix longispora TaxID=33920 RepID=A0ABU1PNQ0_9PSEU|nr:radical SAM protein [Saccharothrix longispora]MDR6592287.1 DNA repair photolyase [Saccharothrix longispora]